MRTLFIAWQDPEDRRWYPVGRLAFDGSEYRFAYTRGAAQSPRFQPFGSLKDLYAEYVSDRLFPLFTNRLLPVTRPEFDKVIEWLGLSGGEYDQLTTLSRSTGIRATDRLYVFEKPKPTNDGRYEVSFFVHGIRYVDEFGSETVNKLKPGDRLFTMLDDQNPVDTDAVAFRTSSPIRFVGYCPRFLARDIRSLLSLNDANSVVVTVSQVNDDAPVQLRLLFHVSAPWPKGFEACSDDLYEPIGSSGQEPRTLAAGQPI